MCQNWLICFYCVKDGYYSISKNTYYSQKHEGPKRKISKIYI